MCLNLLSHHNWRRTLSSFGHPVWWCGKEETLDNKASVAHVGMDSAWWDTEKALTGSCTGQSSLAMSQVFKLHPSTLSRTQHAHRKGRQSWLCDLLTSRSICRGQDVNGRSGTLRYDALNMVKGEGSNNVRPEMTSPGQNVGQIHVGHTRLIASTQVNLIHWTA